MNALRIMRAVDFHEMINVGLMRREDREEYQIYNEDPYRWAIRLDTERSRKFWKLIQNRQTMELKQPVDFEPLVNPGEYSSDMEKIIYVGKLVKQKFPELDVTLNPKEDTFNLKIGNHEIGRNQNMPNFWVSNLINENKTEEKFPQYVHPNLMHVVAMVCKKELDRIIDRQKNDLIGILDISLYGDQTPEP